MRYTIFNDIVKHSFTSDYKGVYWLADSDRKGEPWAAHDARNTDKAVCTDLHSASVSTRLAVYIQTLAPSGRVKPSRHCCNAEEVRSAMGQSS